LIRMLIGILIALLAIAFSWFFVILVIPFAGILTGLPALLSFLVGIGVVMVLPTIIIIGIVFLFFLVPIKLIQNSRK